MRDYRWHAAAVLLLILVHTHVTLLPGWTVPVLPLVLVTAAVAMLGALCWTLRPSRARAPITAPSP